MNQADDKLIGRTVLGRYRIVRQLASGGMGVVYLARSEGAAGFVKPVVIKRVLPHLAEDDSVLQLFVREAHILANLQHPGIVDVVDFAESDGAYIMVLEYVHGYHLGKWLKYLRKRQRQLPVDLALHITSSVLRSLHYAHTRSLPDGTSQGIIHRDVSPANVLLDAEGHIKLTDFGIARMQARSEEHKTVGSKVKGKFQYMAPELLDGGIPSAKGDVFATAVVLHEMLVGQNEFLRKEIGQTVARVLEHPPSPLDAARDDIPEGLDAVVQRGLAKDPDHRYADASVFAQDLRRFISLPDDDAGAWLAAWIRHDFHGKMPEWMKLEPLDVLERAWRNEVPEVGGADKGPSAAPSRSEGPAAETRPGARFPSREPEADSPVRAGTGDTHATDVAVVDAANTPPAPPRRRPRYAPRLAWLAAAGGVLVAGGVAALTMGPWSGSGASGSDGDARYIVVDRREGRPESASDPGAGTEGAGSSPSADAPPASPDSAEAGPSPRGRNEPGGTAEPARAANDPGAPSGAERPERHARSAGRGEHARRADPEGGEQARSSRLTRAFARRRDRVQECFAVHADELEGSPRVSIRFRVSSSGGVESAELRPAELSGTSLGECLLEVARKTEFGQVGKPVSFRIPITVRHRK